MNSSLSEVLTRRRPEEDTRAKEKQNEEFEPDRAMISKLKKVLTTPIYFIYHLRDRPTEFFKKKNFCLLAFRVL